MIRNNSSFSMLNATSNMFDKQYSNETDYNFTMPFNSTFENSNASRHFADEPNLSGIISFQAAFISFFLLVVSIAVLSFIIMLIRLHCFERMLSSSRTEIRNEVLQGTPREIFSLLLQNSCLDRFIYRVPINDASTSIYPGDTLPSYANNSEKDNLFLDVITTPISNNSVITMTMRNNHLIVETEERVPVNYSVWNSTDQCSNSIENVSQLSSQDSDDVDSYCEDLHLDNIYTMKKKERRQFYEATTSKQADEEDLHVEVFHKQIPACLSQEEKEDLTSSYSCDYNEEQTSSVNGPVTTGFVQSDLTGSSSSTSRHVQNDYGYGNQCEYEFSESQKRKSSSSFRLTNNEKAEVVTNAYSSPFLNNSEEDSVLPLSDCSSAENSEPSK